MIIKFKLYETLHYNDIYLSLKEIIKKLNNEFDDDFHPFFIYSENDNIFIRLNTYFVIYKIKKNNNKIYLYNEDNNTIDIINIYNEDNITDMYDYIEKTLMFRYLCYLYCDYYIKINNLNDLYDLSWFIDKYCLNDENKNRFIDNMIENKLPKSIIDKYKYLLNAKNFDLI